MSASLLSAGRVVVMTHGSYLTDFVAGNNSDLSLRRLHQNIKIWMTRGKYNGS